MEDAMEFREVQRFRQWWLWAIIGLAVLIPAGILVYQLTGNSSVRYEPPGNAGGFIGITLIVLVILLFLSIRLETIVDNAGITYRFFPVHLKQRHIPWPEVAAAYVRKYRPIGEYGGWGIRYGFGSGTALNISGNRGLQIVFKDGKKMLFGTRKPEELKRLLSRLEKQGALTVVKEPS
jgi:hypothetical protein